MSVEKEKIVFKFAINIWGAKLKNNRVHVYIESEKTKNRDGEKRSHNSNQIRFSRIFLFPKFTFQVKRNSVVHTERACKAFCSYIGYPRIENVCHSFISSFKLSRCYLSFSPFIWIQKQVRDEKNCQRLMTHALYITHFFFLARVVSLGGKKDLISGSVYLTPSHLDHLDIFTKETFDVDGNFCF